MAYIVMATVPNRFAPHAVAANDVKCASVLLSIDVHDRMAVDLAAVDPVARTAPIRVNLARLFTATGCN